ncbi:hypothetical protein NOGI109294_17555 [Nocardiopsis gilva]
MLRALLRGERANWDGAVIEMLHRPGFAPPRPIDVPVLVGAQAPKGAAVARESGYGVFGAVTPVPGFDWSAALTFGTVLRDGEDPGSERGRGTAGHAAAAIMHFAVEFDRLELIPAAEPWASA